MSFHDHVWVMADLQHAKLQLFDDLRCVVDHHVLPLVQLQYFRRHLRRSYPVTGLDHSAVRIECSVFKPVEEEDEENGKPAITGATIYPAQHMCVAANQAPLAFVLAQKGSVEILLRRNGGWVTRFRT